MDCPLCDKPLFNETDWERITSYVCCAGHRYYPNNGDPAGYIAMLGAIKKQVMAGKRIEPMIREETPEKEKRKWIVKTKQTEMLRKRRDAAKVVGKMIKNLRETAGLTQATVAKALGMSLASWSHYEERGEIPSKEERIQGIADYLGIDRGLLWKKSK
jgi:DNA-binding transcriptional regulator YiaG